MSQSTATPARSQNINIRVAPAQRTLIDQAAAAVGKTRTEFILEAATREAESTLLDQRVFVLDAEQWDAFVDALDAPPRPMPKLQKLMETTPLWET